MKFMASWKIPPGCHKPAAEGFIKTGAPAPAGVTILGRWHAPGSVYGWVLVETDDVAAVAEHVGQWANLLEMQVTPVIEDEAAAGALTKAYGGQGT